MGKTTSTINIGTSMNELGEDVIIIDGNLTTSNITIETIQYGVVINQYFSFLQKFDCVSASIDQSRLTENLIDTLLFYHLCI